MKYIFVAGFILAVVLTQLSTKTSAAPFRACGCDIACPCSSSKWTNQDCCSPKECKCPMPSNPNSMSIGQLKAWHASHSNAGCCKETR